MMRSDKIAEIYDDAYKRWGAKSQVVMAIEECAELTKELTKYLRSDASISNMAEEIADVEIMIEQLRSMFPGVSAEADAWREKKLLRLRKMLDETD